MPKKKDGSDGFDGLNEWASKQLPKMEPTFMPAGQPLFRSYYIRNNKGKGNQKNLRCFPRCSNERHMPTGFCGEPLRVRFPCLSSSGKLRAYGHFKAAPTPVQMRVGDLVDPKKEFSDLQTASNPIGSWWECMCVERQENTVIFELNSDRRGWHYGYVSNRFADMAHSFVVYLTEESQYGHTCISIVHSTNFKLVSQRRAKCRPQPPVPVPNISALQPQGTPNDWVQHLQGLAKLPQNRGKKIRDQIRMAYEMCPDEQHKQALAHSISKGVYKANACGKTIQLASDVLKAAQIQMANKPMTAAPCKILSCRTSAEVPLLSDFQSLDGFGVGPSSLEPRPVASEGTQLEDDLSSGDLSLVFDQVLEDDLSSGDVSSMFDEEAFGDIFNLPEPFLESPLESGMLPEAAVSAYRQDWDCHSRSDYARDGRPRKCARQERHLRVGDMEMVDDGMKTSQRIKAIATVHMACRAGDLSTDSEEEQEEQEQQQKQEQERGGKEQVQEQDYGDDAEGVGGEI
jgi:hypothetical protein